jgi:predicted RecB family nuclease
MLVTRDTFAAFLLCKTKAYKEASRSQAGVANWNSIQTPQQAACNAKCIAHLLPQYGAHASRQGQPFCQPFHDARILLAFDCQITTEEVSSGVFAIERRQGPDLAHSIYTPFSAVPTEYVSRNDKLLLAFDALALAAVSPATPEYGKIFHGLNCTCTRILFARLLPIVKQLIRDIVALQASSQAPELVLNKHCTQCVFREDCRKKALDMDDLSLLAAMGEKDRAKLRRKGIFTVTQLSYTFRPRRNRRSAGTKKYYHSLKALAVRERKVLVAGVPGIRIDGTPVYLDVEGVPTGEFYYLIGVRVGVGDSARTDSFWADTPTDERANWDSLVRLLQRIDRPLVIHYGSYEKEFLKTMKKRYGDPTSSGIVDKLTAEAVNIVGVIYASIYFPTYSNSLKEVANYLGFRWSDAGISGSISIQMRYEWESSRSPVIKQSIITYTRHGRDWHDCGAQCRGVN